MRAIKRKLILFIIIILCLPFIFKVYTYKSDGFTNNNIFIAYHIYCNKNTEQILKDQLNTIQQSGILNSINEVRCYLTGDSYFILQCKHVLSRYGSKFKVILEKAGDTTYERFTLEHLQKTVLPSDKFLYIHTKGVTKPDDINVYYWRKWMEYFLITKYKDSLNALNQYDVVGINYCGNYKADPTIGPHFSGNFWWSNGNYFISLPKKIGNRYNDPETYILLGNPNFLELDKGRIPECTQLYNIPIKPTSYLDS